MSERLEFLENCIKRARDGGSIETVEGIISEVAIGSLRDLIIDAAKQAPADVIMELAEWLAVIRRRDVKVLEAKG